MLFCALLIQAQNISVNSFRLLETDLTANNAETMVRDQNGDVAALIKVVTTQNGFSFDVGQLGVVKTVQMPAEIWVYVPRGIKKISISHPQLGILRDYYLNIPIEAARTYEMVLVTGTVETIIRQARTSQYVVFQLTPSNAVVEIDGELLQTDGGIATKMMKFGTYNYRVQAPNYLPEAGNVTVNDPKNKHIVNVNLKPNFSVVTITVDNDAEIWVNGERKGTGSWTGNLVAGTYVFEAKKENHRDSYMSRDIVVSSESQTITLQAPTPILGEADINSSPAMADIYIDGKKVGQTPQMVSDLLVGQHQLRISKEGFKNYSAKLILRERETSMISAKLEKEEAEQETASTAVKKSSSDSNSSPIVKEEQPNKVIGTATTSPKPDNKKAKKIEGYRLQVYEGDNSRQSRIDVEKIGEEMKRLFPTETVYVQFYSPKWVCRIGNYRTYDEALEIRNKLRGYGYQTTKIMKGKITVFE